MKNLSPKELSEKLSRAVDDALTDVERRELEEYCLQHPDAQRELDELKKLKGLVAAQQPLAPDSALWTRLSVAIEKHKEEESNLLPFPRRFIPAAVALVALVAIVGGILTFQNRLPLLRFFNEKSKAVKDVYTEGLLKGSILPLFSNIDKNQALQFALFGMLPLDAKAETALRVDENAEKGYRIEVGRPVKEQRKPVTFSEFLTEINPSQEQKETIDSLMDFAQHRIENSVYVGENDVVAINADLAQLNRVMVSSIAACLEPQQRTRFGKLLESKDAPYRLSQKQTKSVNRARILESIRRVPQEDRFVVITPETLAYSRIPIEMQQAHRLVEHNVEAMHNFEAQRERMIRRFAGWESSGGPKVVVRAQPAPGQEVPDFFSVEIDSRSMPVAPDPLHDVVMPRVRKERGVAASPNAQAFKFRVFSDSSSPEGVPTIRFYRLDPDGDFEVDLGQTAKIRHKMEIGIHHQLNLDSLKEKIDREMNIQRRDRKPPKPEGKELSGKKQQTKVEP